MAEGRLRGARNEKREWNFTADTQRKRLPVRKNKTARPESRAGGVNYCNPQQSNLSATDKPD